MHRRWAGFTLVELLVVVAILAILMALLLPALSRAKAKAQATACLNNARQWGIAFKAYSDDNGDFVPEEGNTIRRIDDVGSGNLVEGWYNAVSGYAGQAALVELYWAGSPPLPGRGSLYVCPTAPAPGWEPVTLAKAYFMYGMNGRLCINRDTRATVPGVVQVRFTTLPAAGKTILVGEVNGNSATAGAAQSNVTGRYGVGRHGGRGNLAMADGSAGAWRTNDFVRTSAESNDGAAREWAVERKVYWYPTGETRD